MTAKMIYKEFFDVLHGARSTVSVPGTGPRVIAVDPSDNQLWYSFTPSDHHTSRFEVLSAFTGFDFDAAGFYYVGTSTQGGLVTHLYWRRIE